MSNKKDERVSLIQDRINSTEIILEESKALLVALEACKNKNLDKKFFDQHTYEIVYRDGERKMGQRFDLKSEKSYSGELRYSLFFSKAWRDNYRVPSRDRLEVIEFVKKLIITKEENLRKYRKELELTLAVDYDATIAHIRTIAIERQIPNSLWREILDDYDCVRDLNDIF